MKKNKKLDWILSFYESEKIQNSDKEKTLQEISELNIRVIPKFSVGNFLSGVIHSLSKWFFIGCGFYIALLLLISFIVADDIKIIFICALSPFLAVGSVGAVYYNIQPSSIELESSCLYKPKTIFAGKFLMCGIFDLVLVVFGSVVASLLGGSSVKRAVILSLLGFALSSLIVLSLCAIFKPKTALILSLGIVLLIFTAFLSKKELFINAFNYLIWLIPYLITALLAMICLLCFIAVKNFEYENLVKKYED